MAIDLNELRGYIADMYSDVASYPRAEFHFPTGRPLMEQLGYPSDVLDRVPEGAMESFAGVGYHFGLAPLSEGERVLDIGSGAGSDALFAALQVGSSGRVLGIDMTDKMLEKSRENLSDSGLDHTRFDKWHAEDVAQLGEQFDCVISNGVINLSPDKETVFAGIYDRLVSGGRLMFSDIVTGVELPDSVRENCELWAECIGGAVQRDRYLRLIEQAGMKVEEVKDNDYRFTQESTLNAADKFQVTSISILARKP
jgi:ubiquinone/menaquinone biosynthesis C-methylase UbiE